MNHKIYLQITSGRGPAECCRVVALVLEKILSEAQAKGIETEVLYREAGPINRTLASATLSLSGKGCDALAEEWKGSVQWIAQSPYRIYHKRKNWFVGVNAYKQPEHYGFSEKEISYQTLRASGPGGQHVNKTESAVRAIHLPSGISVMASDQRSQLQNKKLATERLIIKLAEWNIGRIVETVQENWSNHNTLERGNPIKTFQEVMKK
ncbi:peptide chain release factor H [Bacteroides sp. 224]|uniref:peptide chain release factor H n=1 Tax=Bacteroides sp. 224 TaxID=2302936 RepID=UPI0013D2F48A|nr:peptide chain release factor H [Bacteroides sp. 224]NDV64382.1 peptide chain release factor H [Bacteroides sp. 224]